MAAREESYVPWLLKKPKCIQYNFNPKLGFVKRGLLRKMFIYGFDSLPAGFNRKGFGFTGPYGYLVGDLRREHPVPIEFHVGLDGKPAVQPLRHKTKVLLPYQELRDHLDELKGFKTERNNRSKLATAQFLHAHFPKRFPKPPQKLKARYEGGRIAHILRTKGLIGLLSKEDVEGLAEFYPRFLRGHGATLSKKKVLQTSKRSKDVGEAIYLGNVIREFERMLKRPGQREQVWQTLLKEHILLFNTNYSAMIEKRNISLKIDLPDFLLINIYEYIDIYEIKKPATPLLRFDAGRKNYYWSTEIAKAIAQVEIYIEELQHHADEFRNELFDEEGVKIRVVKPRAYIIAGQSAALRKPRERDFFKMLNGSLKNVEIILYDDFLQNLKNLHKRLTEGV